MTSPVPPDQLPDPAHCPVCADTLGASARRCDRCETPHHPECWDYVGGCAVFACQRPAATETRLAAPTRELTPTLVRLFTGAFRASWWAFLALSVGMLSLLVGAAWGRVGFAVGVLTVPLMFLGAFAYVLLLPCTLLLQGGVEASLGRKLEQPRRGWRPVLDRLDLASTDAMGLAVIRSLPALTAGAVAAGALLGLLVTGPWMLVVGLFLGPFAYGLACGIRSATEGRLVFLSTMQNRLLLASKGKDAG